ncbi:phage tail tape measure protein [Rhizobium straminoryzae]|uniref:Phage tail tape measure protein n=1 Tax=Rhizobium straminoryzae TaxID=1387186 RepID=A0A549SM39_9HYPH|nr:phage tail tape measure protein [Rhizobium straminoryzae]TRL30675.1 phage tail tape measure protein [Rhizobium straminoryzae]
METDSASLDDQLTATQALSAAMSDLESRSERFGAALTSALKSSTVSGRSLEDVLKGLGNRLTDMALSPALKPLESTLSGFMSGLGGSLLGSSSSVTAFADGGVVRAPTYFPMGGDLGLMGEAGAEAILPLKRGADGALGVAAGTGGGAAQIVFNVTATDAASFRKSEGQVSAMLARSVARGRRGL